MRATRDLAPPDALDIPRKPIKDSNTGDG